MAILKYLREILKYIRIFGFFAPQAREKKSTLDEAVQKGLKK